MILDTTKNVCTCQTGPMNAAKKDCTTCSTGTYFDVNLQTCLKCSSNCAVCSGSTTCTQCNAYYLLKGGSCSCGTSINRGGKCVACASGQYWTGTSCASCSSVTSNCSSCMNTSGKCKTCASPFVLSPTFTCDCPTGQFFDGSTCATIVTCPAGQYRTAQNTCQNCGSDCSTC